LKIIIGGRSVKERLSITIDSDLFSKIEKISKEENVARSKIMEEALTLWEQQRIENLMRKGYLEMAKEDLDLAEFDLEAGNEVMDQ
jgi:metal-responsive CopG/Arc/MetJ family transcriptional regulator